MRLAAIDIGSNSIKLVVVEATSSDSFAVLLREKVSARLGHDTLRNQELPPEAFERAADTVGRFRSIAEARGAEKILAVATASAREARNAAEFITEIERRTGVHIEILSSIEEARLIGVAVVQSGAAQGEPFINIDIGGGSTELSVMDGGAPIALFSMRLGAVGLTEKYLLNDPPKPKELRALKDEIRSALERPTRESRGVNWKSATGTSGTIISIGEALFLQEASLDQLPAQIAFDIALNKLEKFNQRVSVMSLNERRAIPGISAQRSEILIAGGQILEGVMRSLNIGELRTRDYALREGVIIDYLREVEAESLPPMPYVSEPRLRSVQAVGKRFGYEEAHAHQVARLAELIFDGLAQDYKLVRHQRLLLSAAALLHDAGYHIAHESHHKHALYLIKHSELTGFSEAEKNLIANIARYHRGAMPKERHLDFAALGQHDRQTVWQLGSILRLADALDRRYDSRVKVLTCELKSNVVHIQLRSEVECEREIEAAVEKTEMFETAFGCKTNFSYKISAEQKKI
jgi:exopolyphosphatase/guanosine-5'-triphosphate,3'-diphosphate pyrophosphatase